jgi:hypothetical protein
MIRLLLPLCLSLCGCQAYRMIGITPLTDFNTHIDEAQDLAQKGLENQGDISSLSVELANENIRDAKKDGDDAKLERSIGTKIKAEIYTKRANKLSETEFTKKEGVSFDWGSIIQMILTGLGAAFPALGGVLFMMKGKLNRVTEKAKYFAESTDKNDIAHDRDLA